MEPTINNTEPTINTPAQVQTEAPAVQAPVNVESTSGGNNKLIIIALVVLLVLGVAGYFYYVSNVKTVTEQEIVNILPIEGEAPVVSEAPVVPAVDTQVNAVVENTFDGQDEAESIENELNSANVEGELPDFTDL